MECARFGFWGEGGGGIKNPLGVGEPLGLYPSALDWPKRKRKWWLYWAANNLKANSASSLGINGLVVGTSRIHFLAERGETLPLLPEFRTEYRCFLSRNFFFNSNKKVFCLDFIILRTKISSQNFLNSLKYPYLLGK